MKLFNSLLFHMVILLVGIKAQQEMIIKLKKKGIIPYTFWETIKQRLGLMKK